MKPARAILAGWVLCAAAARGEGAGRVSASTVHPGGYEAALAFDGRGDTRWASAGTRQTPEWLAIDLGAVLPIESIAVLWEAAHAAEFSIEVSDDGKTWREIARKADGKGGRDAFSKLGAQGRHVRVACHRNGAHGLYSIWEVEFEGPVKQALVAAAAKRAAEGSGPARAAIRAKGVREIVFAARENGSDGHWYANFGYYAQDSNRKCYRQHGRLVKLDLETGSTTNLVDDPEGSVRDPAVHYDGRTIVFSWRKAGTDSFHLYEIQSDGSGLRQLTDGAGHYDDIEPCWLPDGGIVFVSSRCKRWVNCWLTQVGILHRCDRDGRNVQVVSANIEHDNTPWVLPDGRIAYMRWEYVDRSQVHYHHLWAMNPDGTGQQILFGNMVPGGVFIDAKPVPGSDRIVLINSPGHGQREHMGHVALLNLKHGPDEMAQMRNLTDASYRDPYALDEGTILAARHRSLMLVTASGETREAFGLGAAYGPAELHEPRPLVPRPREAVIAPRSTPSSPVGEFVLSDVYDGRSMEGVARGEIKTLLVLESLPKPINYTGGMDPLSYGGTFTLERIVGTVPVEADGSARFELPANRAFFFVAQDAAGRSVKRMQSFTTAMPGETVGCVGCHEPRTRAPENYGRRQPLAMARAPSVPAPVPGVPDVMEFPRDVQPVLDALCVKCHGYEKTDAGGPRAARLILSGDRGPMFSHSYYMMTVAGLFSDGRNNPKSNYGPRALGSGASRILTKIDGSHHGVKATPEQERTLRYWIDSGAAYPGTYAALGEGVIGAYAENRPVNTDGDWETTRAGAEVLQRRCVECHKDPARVLPMSLSDERGLSFWRPDWKDPRLNTSRHIVFNLSRPEKSILLLGPLVASGGGWGLCRNPATGDPVTVFADTNDPDYRKLLAMAETGRANLEKIGRFDMPGFRPPMPYVREMKRYGILPADLPEGAPVNPYETDRRYWESLWYRPPVSPATVSQAVPVL